MIHETLRRSILKILTADSLRFWGLILYNLEFKVAEDDPLTPTMTIYYDRGWYCRYNPDFVNGKSETEMVYIVIHELVHMLNGHCFRCSEEYVWYIWAIAIDHVVNVALDHDMDCGYLKSISKPQDRTIFEEIKDKNWTAEQVYKWLVENAKVIFLPPTMVVVEVGDKHYQFPIDMIVCSATLESLKALRDLVSQARAHINSDRSRGLLRGFLRELLSDLIDVVIPPEVILEDAIKNMLSISDNRSWRSVNKRLFAHGILAPADDTELLMADVVCLVDHSGSISKEEAKAFSGAIRNCAHLFKRLHIVKHDAAVDKDGGVTILDRDEVYRSGTLFEMIGRGGTSHKEPFDYCQQLCNQGEEISLVLVFTDWASDIPAIWDKYTWHTEFPVLNIIPKGKSWLVPDRFGKKYELFKGK